MRRTPYAYLALLAFQVILSLSVLLGWVAYYHSSQASQQRQEAAEKLAAQRAAAAVEQKLCATLKPLAGLAGLRPPAGNPADNQSRAFEQHLVVKLAPLAQLGPDLGCGKARP